MNRFLAVINELKEFAKPFNLSTTIELVGSEETQNRPPEGLFYRNFEAEGKSVRFTVLYKKSFVQNETTFLESPILDAIKKKYLVLSESYFQDEFFKVYTFNIETVCV